MKRFVIDASALLKAFFPDEEGQLEIQTLLGDWVEDRVEILAPALLHLEVTNAVLVALRRGRISHVRAQEIIHAVDELSLPVGETSAMEEIFKIAVDHGLSAYDAAYAALATEPCTLVTGDEKLYAAVKGKIRALRIADYK